MERPGHLGKVSLILLRLLLLIGIFLVKEKVVAGGNIIFSLFDAHKTSFITALI